MKVLLVFVGLLFLNVTFISYKADLDRYLQLRTFLKAVAEECAGGAALYYDEEAYGRGLMIFKEGESVKYVDDLVARATDLLKLGQGEELSYEMELIDDRGAGGGLPPAVVVILRLTTADLFRLPFITVEQITRAAKYELADSNP